MRVRIQPLAPTTGFRFGKLQTDVVVCSYHGDEHGNRALLLSQWRYHEPCGNYSELVAVNVRNMGSLQGEGQQAEADWTNADQLLEEWRKCSDLWIYAKNEVACTNDGTKDVEISIREEHVLQHLSRFQTAVAATVERGHPEQYYLCELVYWIGSFIERKNRENEHAKGLLIQTPEMY